MGNKKRVGLAVAMLLLGMAGGLAWYLGVMNQQATAATAGALAQENDRPARTVGVVAPRPVDGQGGITLPGRARAATQATLFFRVSAPLCKVHAAAGDRVEKGALLLELDDRDFKRQVAVVERQLASARANLMKLQAGARPEDVRIIRSNLAAARADLALAEKELDRHEILFENQAVSEQAYDRAQNQVNSLTARVAALDEQLARDTSGARKEDIMAARAGVEELETRLAIAGDQLRDTKLVAPFSGVVTQRFPEAHEMVVQGQPVITLDDYTTVEIPVAVPEAHVRSFLSASGSEDSGAESTGQAAEAVFLVDRETTYPALLTEYSGRADQATGTYEFVFSVTPGSEDLIFPGMSAEIRLAGVSAGLTPGLAVPLQSLMGVAGNSAHLFCVDRGSNTVVRKPVAFEALAGSTDVRVTSGLLASDLVVADGAAFVREGQKVAWERPVRNGEDQ